MSKSIKKEPKGKYGLILQNCVLKTRYKIKDWVPKNSKYDLPLALNSISAKNVSIKSTRCNTIYCGSVFNFLASTSLEMVIIKYNLSSTTGSITVNDYYIVNNLKVFFIKLNESIDLVKLNKLNLYLKSLKYPFLQKEKDKCHSMAKLISKNCLCGFRVNVKLSSKNKRLQCSLNLNLFLIEVNWKFGSKIELNFS